MPGQRKRGILVRELDLKGSCALHLCALCGHPELTELLCHLGADPCGRNQQGLCPLQLVAHCSSCNCLCISNKVLFPIHSPQRNSCAST